MADRTGSTSELISVDHLRFRIVTSDWSDLAAAAECRKLIRSGLMVAGSLEPAVLALAHHELRRGRPNATLATVVSTAYSVATERIPTAALDEHEHAVELRSARSSNVARIPTHEATVPLEGTEDWISTE